MTDSNEEFQNILLCIVEDDPTPVLQTLFTLKKNSCEMPECIHALATPQGKQNLIDYIWLRGDGGLARFNERFGTAIKMSPKDIDVFSDAEGTSLSNLSAAESFGAAGDSLLTWIRDKAKDPNTALQIALPASHPLAAIASLAFEYFARPQDRFWLVLSSAQAPMPLERLAFSSTLADCILLTTDLFRLNPRLRRPESLAIAEGNERVKLELLQKCCEPLLVLDVGNCNVIVNHDGDKTIVHLETSQFAIYLWLAQRKYEQLDDLNPRDPGAVNEFVDVHNTLLKQTMGEIEAKRSLRAFSMPIKLLHDSYSFGRYFYMKKSKINKALKNILPSNIFEKVQIIGIGQRPKKFSINVERAQVQISVNRQS